MNDTIINLMDTIEDEVQDFLENIETPQTLTEEFLYEIAECILYNVECNLKKQLNKEN